MEWYFPQKMEELPELLSKKGVMPHGGGTLILRAGISANGLISLNKLPLKNITSKDGSLEVGAMCSFSAAVKEMKKLGLERSLLVSALDSAASTPIRNRVTVGGSVASLPPWSDLIAPLSIIDAKVKLFGKNAGVYDFSSYLSRSKELLSESVIESIIIPLNTLQRKYSHHRETRVAFDYPSFTIAVNADINDGKITDMRIAVSGTAERVNRLKELESALIGLSLCDVKTNGAAKDAVLNFGRKPSGSPEYLAHTARVQVERALESLLKCAEGR